MSLTKWFVVCTPPEDIVSNSTMSTNGTDTESYTAQRFCHLYLMSIQFFKSVIGSGSDSEESYPLDSEEFRSSTTEMTTMTSSQLHLNVHSNKENMHLPLILIPLTLMMIVFLLFLISLLLKPDLAYLAALKSKKGMSHFKGLAYLARRRPSALSTEQRPFGGMNNYLLYKPSVHSTKGKTVIDCETTPPSKNNDQCQIQPYDEPPQTTTDSVYTEIVVNKGNPISHV